MMLSDLFPGCGTGSKGVDAALFSIAFILSILVPTQLVTEARYWVQSRGRAGGGSKDKEPLTLLYSITYLGGL